MSEETIISTPVLGSCGAPCWTLDQFHSCSWLRSRATAGSTWFGVLFSYRSASRSRRIPHLWMKDQRRSTLVGWGELLRGLPRQRGVDTSVREQGGLGGQPVVVGVEQWGPSPCACTTCSLLWQSARQYWSGRSGPCSSADVSSNGSTRRQCLIGEPRPRRGDSGSGSSCSKIWVMAASSPCASTLMSPESLGSPGDLGRRRGAVDRRRVYRPAWRRRRPGSLADTAADSARGDVPVNG